MSENAQKGSVLTDLPILMREFRADDLHFIKNSWLRSFQTSQRVNNQYYWQGEEKLIDRLLSDPSTACKIACDEQMQDFVMGYAVVSVVKDDNPILHYAYVKATYRRKYIFSMIMRELRVRPSEDLLVTHWTPYCDSLRARYRRLTFNDYSLKI